MSTRPEPRSEQATHRPGVGLDEAIVLFDGTCNFCHGAVWFILDRERHQRFRFASLQSVTGHRLLEERGLAAHSLDSVVLIHGGRSFIHSAAALHIARQLRWPWPLWFTLIAVPPFLRDGLYRWFARRRHRWFGAAAHCRVPPPELRDRFLDGEEPSAAGARPRFSEMGAPAGS